MPAAEVGMWPALKVPEEFRLGRDGRDDGLGLTAGRRRDGGEWR